MPRPKKIWRGDLSGLAEENPPRQFTAADVAQEQELSYAAASNLLRRLKTWGHIRLVGFLPAASKTGQGRRKKVYEVTDHGRKSAAFRKGRKR